MITYTDILVDKQRTDYQLREEWKKLQVAPDRGFVGNRILYHYQMDQICRTSTYSGSLYDIFQDNEKLTKLLANVAKLGRAGSAASRVFEAWRINSCVALFRPTNAIYVYRTLGATAILDPTAGWGGRLLGAAALGLRYTGIDTNLGLKKGYDDMIATLGITNATLLWHNCLDIDFSQIDYDLVLTSPPYINQELYSYMTPFESKSAFYKNFLIPLLNSCRRHIRRNGWTCFNISLKMYDELLKEGYETAHRILPLSQQKRVGIQRGDVIYCWKPIS